MTVTTSYEQRLSRIHETGYWRVIIRPTVFEERRVPTLGECWSIVESARVSLRGWDYPQLDPAQQERGNDWVQSGRDWANHIEFWRFYQSGQFIQHRSIDEDREPPLAGWIVPSTGAALEGPRHLNVVEALFTLTEILEFARGLAYKEVLDPFAEIQVELYGTTERRLVAPPTYMLRGAYVATDDSICWRQSLPAVDLIAAAPAHAVDAAIHIFERFGWDSPPRGVLEEHQRRLLERRL